MLFIKKRRMWLIRKSECVLMRNYCYRPQWSCGKVMLYTCLSFCHEEGGLPHDPPGHTPPGQTPTLWADTHPQSRHPSRQTPPAQCMLGYGQQAGGTHPTGMQFRFKYFCQHLWGKCLKCWKLNLLRNWKCFWTKYEILGKMWST